MHLKSASIDQKCYLCKICILFQTMSNWFHLNKASKRIAHSKVMMPIKEIFLTNLISDDSNGSPPGAVWPNLWFSNGWKTLVSILSWFLNWRAGLILNAQRLRMLIVIKRWTFCNTTSPGIGYAKWGLKDQIHEHWKRGLVRGSTVRVLGQFGTLDISTIWHHSVFQKMYIFSHRQLSWIWLWLYGFMTIIASQVRVAFMYYID